MSINCLICNSADIYKDFIDVKPLSTSVCSRPLKEFLEESLATDLTTFEAVLICAQCKIRVDCLEEALVLAQRLKEQLINDYNQSKLSRDTDMVLKAEDGGNLNPDSIVESIFSDDPSDAYCSVCKDFRCTCRKPARPQSQKPSEFICETCGGTYRTYSGWKNHVREKHSEAKRLPCPKCERTFPHKGSLQKHMRIHNKEYNYQCDQCGKKFIHSTSLHGHKLHHADSRAFKCDLCGMAFRSTSHLNNHKKKHTGEKAFECPVCHARFAWKYNMQCHVRTVHEGGPSVRKNYNCLICAVKFERKLKLTQHMETVHQVDTAIVHKPVSAHDEPL